MMKLKKKLLSSAMAVALAGSAGVANAIQVSEKGIGQVLMSPLYLAEYGYNSKVAIVNTNDDTAVKTRVALRSHVNSIEFDFLCYMTPADVCRFEIVRGADGQAYLKSNDDSLLVNRPTTANNFAPKFASQCAEVEAADPTGYPSRHYCQNGYLYQRIFDVRLPTNLGDAFNTINDNPNAPDYVANADDNANDPDYHTNGQPVEPFDAHPSNPDSNEIGHMDVIGVWAARGSVQYNSITDAEVAASRNSANPLQNRVNIVRGMSKAELYKIFGPVVPATSNGDGITQSRFRLAGYDMPFQQESYAGAGFADGRLVGAACQADPMLAADAVQGSSIVEAANYGDTCFVTDPVNDARATAGSLLSYDPAVNGSRLRSTDSRWIRLTGTVEMENTASGDRMGLRMAALDGDIWDNLMPADHTPAYGMYSYSFTDLNGNGVGDNAAGTFEYAFDGRVVSNPTLDTNTAELMTMGGQFAQSRAGVGNVGVVYDNIIEIERALAASSMASSYENDGTNLTNVVVTFPTKYRHISQEGYMCDNGDTDTSMNNICVNGLGGVTNGVNPSDLGDVCASEWTVPGGSLFATPRADLYDGRFYYPPFRSETSGSVMYGIMAYDNQENTVTGPVAVQDIFSGGRVDVTPATVRTVTDEVNYMWVSWPFTSGWFNLSLTAVAGCQYTGVPVLAYAHKTQRKDGIFTNSWLVPLTKDKQLDRN